MKGSLEGSLNIVKRTRNFIGTIIWDVRIAYGVRRVRRVRTEGRRRSIRDIAWNLIKTVDIGWQWNRGRFFLFSMHDLRVLIYFLNELAYQTIFSASFASLGSFRAFGGAEAITYASLISAK